VDFRLLGPLEVYDGRRAVAIGGGKRRSLLALLVLRGNEVVSTDRLIDELWGARPPPTAGKGLQVCVSQLRKELARRDNGQILATRSNGYVLCVEPDEVDVRRFERALSGGEHALAAGEPERAAERLREALALWRGPPLADFTYEPFAQQEIARLEELRLVALEQRIDADLALGAHAQVVGELEALVRAHPLREQVRGKLMLALYRCGRQAEALATHRDGRRLMIDELGLEPTPQLGELEAKILAHSPELAAPAARPQRLRRAPDEPADAATAPHPRRRLATLVLLGGAVLLCAVVVAATLRSDPQSPRPTVALDLAKDSLVGLSRTGHGPDFAVPLPGRPIGLAAARGRVFIATVDSAALTVVDARTRALVRTVPMSMTPGAIATEGNRVWLLDRRRGLVLAFQGGYANPSMRVSYHRPPAESTDTGRGSRTSTALATGAGAIWLTDGSSRLGRIDPRTGTMSTIRADRPLDGVTTGAGAVWAFSARRASVLRVDPQTGAMATIPIAAKSGSDAPLPVAIATTPGTVWVLNANTATLSRIDANLRGVTATVPIGIDRLPRAMTTAGRTVLIANFDGSVSRLQPGDRAPSSLWIGESLGSVAADGERVWVTTTALDRQLPGGTG
jgi:DNA-binding SARP family transcriptional activator